MAEEMSAAERLALFRAKLAESPHVGRAVHDMAKRMRKISATDPQVAGFAVSLLALEHEADAETKSKACGTVPT